jgi:protein-S-isoprenylcysteine O-methyltransferase Ste14
MLSSSEIVFLAVLAWGLLHSILASLSAKKWARERMGPTAGRLYRLFFNLIAAITLLPVLALSFLLPDRVLYHIPFPWILLTLLVQALATLALLYGLLQTGARDFLGLAQLLRGQTVRPRELVRGGLYRWVRHPLYAAGLLLIWLTPVMTVNVLALNIGLTLYILIGIRYEERKLEAEFGADYAAYRRATPMLIPFLKFPSRDKSTGTQRG